MKLLKCAFKVPFLLSTVLLDFAKNIVVPGQKLMIWLFIVYLLDFVTGIIKAYIIKDPISSKKMRDSIGKMLQYAGLILLVMIMANATFKEEIAKAGFIIDGIYMLAILIEARSIAENFKEMAPDSTITKLILNPLLLVFENQAKVLSNNISPQQTAPQSETQVVSSAAKMIIAFILIGSLTACSAVKTKEHAQLETSTNMHALAKDSGTSSFQSSVYQMQTDSLHVNGNDYAVSNGLNIHFFSTPDSASTPVVIEHLANKTVINAGNRKIASVSISNDSAATIQASTAVSTNASAATAIKDSTFIKISDEAKSSWTQEQKDFIKGTMPAAYVLFCLLGVAIILLLIGILWIKEKNDQMKSNFKL